MICFISLRCFYQIKFTKNNITSLELQFLLHILVWAVRFSKFYEHRTLDGRGFDINAILLTYKCYHGNVLENSPQ